MDEPIADSKPYATFVFNHEGEQYVLRIDYERLREMLRWIPVSERLPEEGVDVLMSHARDGWVGCGACRWSQPGGATWSYGETEMQYPTHWMPLPELPEAK